MKNLDLKIAGFCGILAPLITILLVLIAVYYSPWFSWSANALSDLGAEGTTSALFNSSLILCGLLIIPFALGLIKFLDQRLGKLKLSNIDFNVKSCQEGLRLLSLLSDRKSFRRDFKWNLISLSLGKVGALALVLTAIILCGIGIFPENAGAIHLYLSIAFFMLLPVSLFVIGISMITSGKDRKLGFAISVLSICSAVIWLAPKNGVAIQEFIASVAGTISCVLLGIKLVTLNEARRYGL
jgi:hypothetical membrane protein